MRRKRWQRKHIPERLLLETAESEALTAQTTTVGLINRLLDYGYPEKVCWAKIMWAVDRDYLEYGVSPSFAWLTREGKERLQELRDNAMNKYTKRVA
jgi:hypothetical protein